MSADTTGTALRLIHMLQRLERTRAKSASQLHGELCDLGYVIDLRTVQRDLARLSEVFPIWSDGAKPAGWRWKPEAAGLALPIMEPRMALALLMLEQHAAHLLPPGARDDLQPKWREASQALARLPESGSRQWRDRVRVISRSMPLIPPEIDPGIRDVVFNALLRRERFLARYRRGYQDEVKEYEAHPQALVLREGVVYLVALIRDYDEPRQLALHRFVGAEPLAQRAREIPDFDLDAYIEQGNFAFANGATIRLVARFTEGAGFQLTESKLSDDQKIEFLEDENGGPYCQITATVRDSMQLQWWLQSFGDEVTVISQRRIRRKDI